MSDPYFNARNSHFTNATPGIYIAYEPCSCGKKHEGLSCLSQQKAQEYAKNKARNHERELQTAREVAR